MVKINFVISDILVSKSSTDRYGLEIFLKDGPQLKTKFHDDEQIQNILTENNPQ